MTRPRFTASQHNREIVLYDEREVGAATVRYEVGSFQGEPHPMSMILLRMLNTLAQELKATRAELTELKEKGK